MKRIFLISALILLAAAGCDTGAHSNKNSPVEAPSGQAGNTLHG